VSGSYQRVLSAAELPPGTKKPVQVGGRCILICNAGPRLYAISNICTHAEKPLERGRMSATWIACPTHGARFDLATGKVLNPPAVKPLPVYEVRVVDEWIEVLIEETASLSGESRTT
jgi:3-phenylpropionate/trans-cinnamate dioxygenase ferredoxin component